MSTAPTFESWYTAHRETARDDFSKRGTPSHLYGCSEDCLRAAWVAGQVEREPTWISVDDEDHKPPIRESYRNPAPYVLACDAKGRMSVAYADKNSIGYVWTMAKPIGIVTHWMPLPDPPEEA